MSFNINNERLSSFRSKADYQSTIRLGLLSNSKPVMSTLNVSQSFRHDTANGKHLSMNDITQLMPIVDSAIPSKAHLIVLKANTARREKRRSIEAL